MAKTDNTYGEETKTPEFRVAFPSVFEVSEQSDKFELTMLVPKAQQDTLAQLQNACIDTAAKVYGGKDKIPKGFHYPFKDGDKPNEAGNIHAGFAGNVAVKVSTGKKFPPVVVDEKREEFIDKNKFYAGCWALAYVTPHVYDYKGKVGVTLYLTAVQKIKDDKHLTRHFDPTEKFDAVEPSGDTDFAEEGAAETESATNPLGKFM